GDPSDRQISRIGHLRGGYAKEGNWKQRRAGQPPYIRRSLPAGNQEMSEWGAGRKDRRGPGEEAGRWRADQEHRDGGRVRIRSAVVSKVARVRRRFREWHRESPTAFLRRRQFPECLAAA